MPFFSLRKHPHPRSEVLPTPQLYNPSGDYEHGGGHRPVGPPPIIIVASWIIELGDGQDIRTWMWVLSGAQKRISWALRAV